MSEITLKPCVPTVEDAPVTPETIEWRVEGTPQEIVIVVDQGVIVLGIPADEDENAMEPNHNCDQMGCGQCHVLWRHEIASGNPAQAKDSTDSTQAIETTT